MFETHGSSHFMDGLDCPYFQRIIDKSAVPSFRLATASLAPFQIRQHLRF